jgi:hypothetical protein
MNPMARLVPILAALLLTACETTSNPIVSGPAAPVENACGAADLQSLVGQNASVVEGMRFSQPMRLLRPGMAVTMDYSAERLNIQVNEVEVIEAVTCG